MNKSLGRLLRYLSLGMLVLALGILSSCNLSSGKFRCGNISDLYDAFLVQEEEGGSYSLMGRDGEIIVKGVAGKDLNSYDDDFIGCYDGIYGIKDSSGGYTLYKLGAEPQELTDVLYEYVGYAADGVIPVQQEDGAPLVLSAKNGKPLFEVKEYKGTPISLIGNNFYGGINYYAVAKRTSGVPPQYLYGFINTKGEFLTAPIYRSVSMSTENDKVYGILPSDEETAKLEVLNNKGKVLFSTTTRITEEEEWKIVLGKDRCVIGDKIFDLKGKTVGRLPGKSIVQSIGSQDYILAREGDDVWYLLDKDGKEINTIRNAMKVFFDTTGKNYVVAENFDRSGEDVFTAYTIKGNKSVYEVSGDLYTPLKNGKFLLNQSSDYVMYDAKGKEIRGKYFSSIEYNTYTWSFDDFDFPPIMHIDNTHYKFTGRLEATFKDVFGNASGDANWVEGVTGKMPKQLTKYLFVSDDEANEAFSTKSSNVIRHIYFNITYPSFGMPGGAFRRYVFTEAISEFDPDELKFRANPNSRLLMIDMGCCYASYDYEIPLMLVKGYGKKLMKAFAKYFDSKLKMKEDPATFEAMLKSNSWSQLGLVAMRDKAKDAAFFSSPSKKYGYLVFLYPKSMELIAVDKALNQKMLKTVVEVN